MRYESYAKVIVVRFRYDCFERLVFNIQKELASNGNPQHYCEYNLQEELVTGGNPEHFCGFNKKLRTAIELCDNFLDLEMDWESFVKELEDIEMLRNFVRMC